MDEPEKSQSVDAKIQYQKMLKSLREERKEIIARNRETMKSQNREIKSIKKALGNAPRTVPFLAKETGLPTHAVLWYVAALMKYGEIVAGESDGGYIHYLLAGKGEKKETGSGLDTE
jgi:hypothetical protein